MMPTALVFSNLPHPTRFAWLARPFMLDREAEMLTNQACAAWKIRRSSTLASRFAAAFGWCLFLEVVLCFAERRRTETIQAVRGGSQVPKVLGFWHGSCVDRRGGVSCMYRDSHLARLILTLRPTEATMSAKKRRKIYGVRRETRRPRGWTRWFQEGFFETEPANSIRLRTVLWGQK